MNTAALPLNEILLRLMFQRRIRPTELSRQLNIPQPTLSRIISGATSNPHISSLLPLAEFFGITIDQLKGTQPILWLVGHENMQSNLSQIPLLTWEQAEIWQGENSQLDIGKNVYTDVNVTSNAYAVIVVDTAMEPQFPKGSMLIIDPDKLPKDRSYVMAKLNNHPTVIFRQLLIDGPYQYLKPISPDLNQFKMSILNEADKILGVLVQARHDYNE